MFLSLFYLLRARGLKVSLNEWMTMLEGLQQGLHASTFTGFYTLCKAAVVHSEADYDKFDQVFLEYFKEIHQKPEVLLEILSWLKHPGLQDEDGERDEKSTGMSREMIEQMFAKRLQDQKEDHNGGKKWIGTGGYTAYGNNIPLDYRVIFVGDAIMALDELISGKQESTGQAPEGSGLENFIRVKQRYSHIIWLHPQPRPASSNYFTKTFEILNGYFDMYQLTVEGLTAGMKKLIVNH